MDNFSDCESNRFTGPGSLASWEKLSSTVTTWLLSSLFSYERGYNTIENSTFSGQHSLDHTENILNSVDIKSNVLGKNMESLGNDSIQKYGTSYSTNILWNTRYLQPNFISWAFFNSMLALVFLLHSYWFCLILRSGYNFTRTGRSKDMVANLSNTSVKDMAAESESWGWWDLSILSNSLPFSQVRNLKSHISTCIK